MKYIDKIVNWLVIFLGANDNVWNTMSFTKYIFTFGEKYLRADYIEYTARRYAKSCSLKVGYILLDNNHTKESYWLNVLNNDKYLKEYFSKKKE